MDDAVQILINYRWPGNVRQLKHIAEQLSVLSQSKVVDVQQLIQALPIEEAASSMPTVASEDKTGVNERELLYRVLFDLKKDVSDLKKVVVKLSTGNINPVTTTNDEVLIQNWDKEVAPTDPNTLMLPQATPSVINPVTISPASPPTLDTDYEEQILSIAEMEKRMIQKALEKYNGRRKEAATELGISERTLYRKIKEYDIDL
jgi:DNA-binding NtrC family response regulator